MTDSSIPDVPAFADELSPLERAELGLQNELSVFEIGQLSYPKENTHSKRKQLTDYLLKAIKGGQLAAYGDPDGWPVIKISWPSDHTEHLYPRCDGHKGSITPDYSQLGGLYRGPKNPFDPFSDYDRPYEPPTHRRTQYKGDWCLVTRADYLAFVESPAAHGIPFPDSWKSSQVEPAPLSQSKPDPPERQETTKKREALSELLAEIDKRAMEQGAGFNRHSLPGTKQEFHKLLNAYYSQFAYIGTDTLGDEYLKGICQFQRGAKPKQGKGAAIWRLFPEHPLK